MDSIAQKGESRTVKLAPEKKNGSLRCLTGARFVAALLVVLFHFGWRFHFSLASPIPGLLFSYGRQAVSFFFILSGIVLTYSYREAITSGTVGWSKFFNLRLCRIVPVHVATWLIATLLHVLFAWRPNQGNHPIAAWLAGLFCLQVYWPSTDNLFRWNGQSWSISCELFFYALFPLLLPPLARRLRSTGSIIAAMFGIYLLDLVLYFWVSGILSRLISPGHPFLGYQTPSETVDAALLVFPPLRLGEFLIGMCIGLLTLQPRPLLRSPFRANLLLGLCTVALVALVGLPRFNHLAGGVDGYISVVPILALVLVSLMSGLTIVTTALESSVAILLGEASYSLYLVHGFFIPGAHYTVLKYIVCVLGSVGSSIVLYWYLERPARRIWRQVLEGRHLPKFKTAAFSDVVQNSLGTDNRTTG